MRRDSPRSFLRLRYLLSMLAVPSILCGFGSTAAGALAGSETALDRYVHKPDDSYGWKLAHTFEGEHGGTAYMPE